MLQQHSLYEPSPVGTIGMVTGIVLTVGIVAMLMLAYFIHRFFEGEHLLLDILDERRLTGADISQLDKQCLQNPDRSDIVVSLTTIPSRLPFIEGSLKSLLAQNKAPMAIYLNVPEFSKREQVAYEIPESIHALEMVQVVSCKDWGPATKAIPSILSLPPDQKIVVVDDDRIYPPNLIGDLERASEAMPDAAIAMSGWVVPGDLTDRPTTILSNLFKKPPAPVRATRLSDPYPIDVFQGLTGYLIKPRFFDKDRLVDYSGMPDAAFFVDDVWMSAHCCADKFIVPSNRLCCPPKQHIEFFKQSSLGRINSGAGDNDKRNNTIMIRALSKFWKVGGENLT